MRDLVAVVGAALVCVGLWQLAPWVALTAGGALLLAGWFFIAVTTGRANPKP